MKLTETKKREIRTLRYHYKNSIKQTALKAGVTEYAVRKVLGLE